MPSTKQSLQWDPKTVEIRTKSVEKSLEPLIKQMTKIVDQASRPPRRGYSKKAVQLVEEQSRATQRLVNEGQRIAADFPDIKEYLLDACEEVTVAGGKMEQVSRDFTRDPCNDQKRASMVRAARALLAAVTRLLCVADMADVEQLLINVKNVEERLKHIVKVEELKDFLREFDAYGSDLHKLLKVSGCRQADLKKQVYKDKIASARSSLRTSSRLLFTASKAHIAHPHSDSALENRDFAVNQLDEALVALTAAVQAYGDGEENPVEDKGDLLLLFDDLLERLQRHSEYFHEKSAQRELRSLVEEVTERSRQAGEMLGESNTVKDDINQACLKTEYALAMLLDASASIRKSAGGNGSSAAIDSAKADVQRHCVELLKRIRNCLAGGVADTFLNTDSPLVALVESAEQGHKEETESKSDIFLAHNAEINRVSSVACAMNNVPEKTKMVKMCSVKLSRIGDQVSHAAKTVSQYPSSALARENLYLVRDMWLNQTKVLTEAVDDITNIDDYLKACDHRVRADTMRAVDGFQENNTKKVHRAVVTIRLRVKRADAVITADLEENKGAPYAVEVESSLSQFKEKHLPRFLEQADNVVKLELGTAVINGEAFQDSAHQVCTGFRNLRKSIAKRNPDARKWTSDSDTDEEEGTRKLLNLTTEVEAEEQKHRDYHAHSEDQRSRPVTSLGATEDVKLNTLVEGLTVDKERLMKEVNKWDEQGNEIIVLAKKMCVIMMDLSHFTRGTGPLSTNNDVINAVEQIAKYGNDMTELVNGVSQKCPQSHARSDLVAYIHQIALYSHQLKLTAKVKAEVQQMAGEEVWTQMGADTAKSLIETARNLMTAVMLTVRACYIASTKHRPATK